MMMGSSIYGVAVIDGSLYSRVYGMGLTEGGMTMQSLYMMTPSLLYRCLLNWWYSLIGVVSWCLD